MRESNFHFPSANKACVSITSALYDRRALDCTADLPLVNSLSHLNFLTSSSARIRDILTTDGGLERLVRILRTTCVKDDLLHNWKWTMAFQCMVNVGVRGTADIRQRVVQVGAVPILVEILRAYLLHFEIRQLEQKLVEAVSAQNGRIPYDKFMDFANDPDGMHNADEHGEINDPSNTVVSSHILASGANHSTGVHPTRSASSAAARSNAQAAAAAAVAAVTGINPIPITVSPMMPSPTGGNNGHPLQQQQQQNHPVGGLGAHPLTRHVSYADPSGAIHGASGQHQSGALPAPYIPYSTNPYIYSEQERLRAERDAASRRLQAINHVMYRHDDVVLTLQLLAYLSKTPSQRQFLHECPLLYTQVRHLNNGGNGGGVATGTGSDSVSGGYAMPHDLERSSQAARCAAEANAAAGVPSPRRRHSGDDAAVDVFSLVERFTVQKTFPSEMVYWSAIVMRNSCRRDESRNNCRQCAYSKCQKWEAHPNEFAKCRRCRKAKYCSKACQSSAWQEGHRYWCSERISNTSANADSNMDEDAVAAAAAAAAVSGSVVAMAEPTPVPSMSATATAAASLLGAAENGSVGVGAMMPPPTPQAAGGNGLLRPPAGGPMPSMPHYHQQHHHHHPYRPHPSVDPQPATSSLYQQQQQQQSRGNSNNRR